MDDQDEGSGGRTGRVRKKSAKVLEMEEFEQAEKKSTVVKKGKMKMPTTVSNVDDGDSSGKSAAKKSKVTKLVPSALESTTTPAKSSKAESCPITETPRAVPAELTLRVPQTQQTPKTLSAKVPNHQVSRESKPDPANATSPPEQPAKAVKKEDPKSVIKYLLSSPPSAGTISTPPASKTSALPSAKGEPGSGSTTKSNKRQLSEQKSSKSKPPKIKRPKIEIMSPSELIPASSSVKSPTTAGPGLKMKITEVSNPLKAHVALDVKDSKQSPSEAVAKPKKIAKKVKMKTKQAAEIKPEITSLPNDETSPPPKKTKVSKKKEKLIQEAISAVNQMPTLAALVAAADAVKGEVDKPMSPPAQKPKKKTKSTPTVKSDQPSEEELLDKSQDEELEETALVIAMKEKKKKKVIGKKKGKEGLSSKEIKTKLPKRAPTAYMLFCNANRASIVLDNPGIEFAGISRKLGELWQTQSSKQKLSWRRKAQRRKKKCVLISTGKGSKESQSVAAAPSAPTISPVNARQTANQKLASLLQKHKGLVVADEAPLSPTKNFSIEPMDVAAHLKLLGESLSIIGMRLQEHKGMIAVQGSLSVLLDSLICACGPLLCLTQQVPGMDGCTPALHAKTLDSVAYVMPGL